MDAAVQHREVSVVHCDNLEEWNRETAGGRLKREGIYVYLWLILEKAMAPHSSTLAWRIPWIKEPDEL